MENLPMIKKLNRLIGKDDLEGNCMYIHKSNFILRKGNEIEKLRRNLVKLGEMNNKIIEVGFNGGHSCALMAEKNPKAEFLLFDIGRWSYTQRCIDYFKTIFKAEYVKGNSNKTILEYKGTDKYDLIHVDGGHGLKTAENDIRNCKKFANETTLLLVDDSNFKRIRDLLDSMIKTDYLTEIEMESMDCETTKYHRLFNYSFQKK